MNQDKQLAARPGEQEESLKIQWLKRFQKQLWKKTIGRERQMTTNPTGVPTQPETARYKTLETGWTKVQQKLNLKQ